MHAMNDEDEWENAVLALICNIPASPKPLAAKLRGDTPISPGIRNTLAELIDPGKPEYLGCKLVFKETGATEKNLRKLHTVAGSNSIGQRSVFRHKAHLKKVIERLCHTDKKS
jgi:hypothetical protein